MRTHSKRGFRPSHSHSRGSPTTKIHVIVDALGNPLAPSLTGGQVHDITQTEALAAEVDPQASSATRATTPTALSRTSNSAPLSRSSRQNRIARSRAIATSSSTPNATSLSVSFNSSESSEASPPATKNSAQFPRRPPFDMRLGLAQMRTRPNVVGATQH